MKYLDPELPIAASDVTRPWAVAAARTAVAATAFCLVVLALLLGNAHLLKRSNPLNHPDMLRLESELEAAGRDQAKTAQLVDEIRTLDRQLRQNYARGYTSARHGLGLLLGGLAVFAIAARLAGALQPRTPQPAPRQGLTTATALLLNQRTRWLVIGLFFLVTLLLAFAAWVPPPR